MLFFEFLCFFLRSFLLCFRLVFLSVCINNRKHTDNNIKNRKTRRTAKTQKNNEQNRNLPAGTWEIFIRGRVEGWISCISVFCFYYSFSVFSFMFLYVFFLFSPSLFKLLPEHNTIHYTKDKQTWNGFVHDLCQMLKAMFKFISNHMTFAADLKVVCMI